MPRLRIRFFGGDAFTCEPGRRARPHCRAREQSSAPAASWFCRMRRQHRTPIRIPESWTRADERWRTPRRWRAIAGAALSERRRPPKMSPRKMNSSKIGAPRMASIGIQMFAASPCADSRMTSCNRSNRRSQSCKPRRPRRDKSCAYAPGDGPLHAGAEYDGMPLRLRAPIHQAKQAKGDSARNRIRSDNRAAGEMMGGRHDDRQNVIPCTTKNIIAAITPSEVETRAGGDAAGSSKYGSSSRAFCHSASANRPLSTITTAFCHHSLAEYGVGIKARQHHVQIDIGRTKFGAHLLGQGVAAIHAQRRRQ